MFAGRFKADNILLVGLYIGEEKPDFLKNFKPLVDEFKILSSKGLKINVDNQDFNVKAYVSHITADLPAKCKLQSFMQFNGQFACSYCYHPGIKTKNLNNAREFTRYLSGSYNNRSHSETVSIMKQLVRGQVKSPSKGVKGISCLISFNDFNLIDGCCIDYLHSVLLGNVKTLLDLWLNPKFRRTTHYIEKKNKSLLRKRILSVKPPRSANRKPRDLDQLSKFKAHEFRDLLLNYLPIFLRGLLRPNYVKHFTRLSAAIYILLGKFLKKETSFHNFVFFLNSSSLFH